MKGGKVLEVRGGKVLEVRAHFPSLLIIPYPSFLHEEEMRGRKVGEVGGNEGLEKWEK